MRCASPPTCFPDHVSVDSFGDALLAALVIAAVSIVLQVDRRHQRRRRVHAARDPADRPPPGQRGRAPTSPGIVFLEIDGLALPGAARARCATAARRRWRAGSQTTATSLAEWEPDLSSQTGASQAGILLGSNEDIPAFRWVEKETGTLMACSSPADCAEIERRHATGVGLLADGGASRGNLLSGEADEVILTVSRMEAEKRANPGYRAFLANGFNVTRALVLFVLGGGCSSGPRRCAPARRDVRPRGHRGGIYPLLRGAMCVIVRDLIVFGVLTDMMRGRPAVYATFSSYDEVAHHSGLERADTLEALRKLDQQFGRIERARRYAPRPYEIVVLSDHGQTQGATFKQRNGYGLDELVERSLDAAARSPTSSGGDEQQRDGRARGRRGDRAQQRRSAPRTTSPTATSSCSARATSGLVYLMEAEAAADARGDRGAPSRADPGAARAPAHRLAARALRRARPGRARRARAPTTSTTAGSRARTRSPPSRRPRPRTCCAPTASRTSPTSWSAASTTPSSTRAARSRS